MPESTSAARRRPSVPLAPLARTYRKFPRAPDEWLEIPNCGCAWFSAAFCSPFFWPPSSLLGSLDVPVEPRSWREIIALYAVSSLITAALLVFGLILTRSVIRLLMERSKQQPGARFKTKMVLGAMAISLLPVIFMFFVSYSLLNRTLGRWFPRPLEIASDETQRLLNDFGLGTLPRLHTQGFQAALHAQETPESFLEHSVATGLDAVWLFDAQGKFLKGGVACDNQPENRSLESCTVSGVQGTLNQTLPSGIEIWEGGRQNLFRFARSCGSRRATARHSRCRLSHQSGLPETLGHHSGQYPRIWRHEAKSPRLEAPDAPDSFFLHHPRAVGRNLGRPCFSPSKSPFPSRHSPKAPGKFPPAISLIKSLTSLRMNSACSCVRSTT